MNRAVFVGVFCVAGCATGPGELRFLDPSTPLGASVVQQHSYVAKLNSEVGDEPVSFIVLTPARLEPFRRTISARLSRDMGLHCPNGRAAASYLLIGQRRLDYLAFVVRVSSVGADGAYGSECGLIYSLDSRGRILGVMSNSY